METLASECMDNMQDLTVCICRAQDKVKSIEIGCKSDEPCYVCLRCGRYFSYDRLVVSETIRCPCCGYKIVAKARTQIGRSVRAI